VFFPASCCFYNKIILLKHFLSVSPVLIGFSTHFLEEFVATEFILPVLFSWCDWVIIFEDLVSILPLLGNFVFSQRCAIKLNLSYVMYVPRFLACDIPVSCLCPADGFGLRLVIIRKRCSIHVLSCRRLFRLRCLRWISSQRSRWVSVVNLSRNGFSATC